MKSKTIILIALFLSSFCLGLKAQWQPDLRLTNDNSGSWSYGNTPSDNNVWCVAASGNDVHVVWYDYRNDVGAGEIYYKNSTDGGVSWGTDIRLTNDPSISVNPSVAVSNLFVHIVWQEQRDGNYEIYYKRSTDGGLSWSADSRLTNSTFDSWNPSVAVSGLVMHLVWQDNRDGNFEIYYKNSTDGGLTWGSDTRLTNDPAISTTPVVCVSGSDVHIAWHDTRDGNDEIYYKHSTDGGLTWGADTRLTNNPEISRYPSIATSGSVVHVVWNDIRNGNWEIYYKNSTDGGNTWGADTRLTSDNNRSMHTSVAVCSSEVNVVWMDNRDGKYSIYYKQSTDGGISWNADLRLTTSLANSLDPSVAVSGSGVHVVWVDERDANQEIYYKLNPSGCSAVGSLCGQKYNDLNGNGVQDPGEPILSDWEIRLTGNLTQSVKTDKEGNYCFNNLLPGSYTVSEVYQTGWVQTQPSFPGTYSVNLASGQSLDNLEFGNQKDTCKSGSKSWSSLGSGFNGQVKALAVMGSELYAGGEFSFSGSASLHNIARWNGSGWSPLGSGLNGFVSSLAVIGTDLYAGGNFTGSGSLSVNSVARWNGTSWSALSNGITGTVRALAVMGGQLYVGGTFSMAGSVTVNSIAKWDGANWSAVGGGTNGYVSALAVNGSDLYAGGTFTTAGSGSLFANNIAKWDGVNWSPLGNGTGNSVTAIAMMGGNVYAAGKFLVAGVVSVAYVAKWDGADWWSLTSGMNGYLYSLAVSGTDLYAGGDITTAGGSGALKIAKWDGSNWSPLGGGMNSNGVFAIAIMGTNLYAGGMFTTAGGISANNVAKWGCGGAAGIDDGNPHPDSQLEQNYPNPFTSTTTIRYVIPQRSSVNISVYNFLGKEIRVLVNEQQDPGNHEVVFDAKGSAGGIYYYMIRTGNSTQSKKMILVK